ncbi:MAG: Ig-like domain-containing protein [Hydrogenophaga sp.]
MPFSHSPARWAAMAAFGCLPLAAMAAGVSVRYDGAVSPFPSNRLTKLDYANVTLRRVNLPKPDCAVQVSDCQDIDVINTLDGFSTQPRITVPFDGNIDLATVNSNTVYLLNLDDTQTLRGFGDKVGINQVLWDSASKTLVFEPDELLAEHSRYLLVVTDGVRDASGKKIKKADMDGEKSRKDWRDRWDRRYFPSFWIKPRSVDEAYQRELNDAMRSARNPRGTQVVAASLFTTQSTTGDLVKIMRDIKLSRPAKANFMIGNSAAGATRAVFNLSDVSGITFNRQNSTTAALTPVPLTLGALSAVGPTVAQVAYGSFQSPNYQVAGEYIPPVASLWGQPKAQSNPALVFQLFVPAGAKPVDGWPVAIFGHGFTDSMYGAPWAVASVFASRGIATMAINVVGHGGGAQGELSVSTVSGAVQVPAGGRGIDQDGSTVIDNTEGSSAAPPRVAISSRDGLRQTVVDLMQLVRQVEVGMDVDGDGAADLNAQRIYYAGQSFGGIYGTMLLGVEPNIQAGVPNVPGGSISEVARLGGFRFLTAIALASRQPQLLNLPYVAPPAGFPAFFGLRFNENIPLRNQNPVVNTVLGASAIAEVLERNEWVQQSGNPVSYASLIRKDPIRGAARKPVIIQFAKGDQTVPNPTSSAIVRAGELEDRTTLFRNDLVVANDTTGTVPKNPHTFLTNIGTPSMAPLAVAGQIQIAEFFKSNGALIIDPDGAAPFFETPVTLPLPETLNFIP